MWAHTGSGGLESSRSPPSVLDESTRDESIDMIKRILSSSLPPPPQYNPFSTDMDPLLRDSKGLTPIHTATTVDQCLWLIYNKADINDKSTKNGDTPLHTHLYNKRSDCVYLLVQAKANINIPNNNGTTLLHISIQKNVNSYNLPARLLISAQADVNAQDYNDGDFPLILAAQYNPDIIQLLLDHNADINQKTFRYEWTALHFAAQHDTTKSSFDILINNKADINIYDDIQCTPLHFAAKNSQDEFIVTLLQHHADINAKDSTGRTPLLYAAQYIPDCIPLLLTSNADINCIDNTKRTVLHYIIQYNNTYYNNDINDDYITTIVNSMANINIYNEYQSTSLHEILNCNYDERYIPLLLQYGLNTTSINTTNDDHILPIPYTIKSNFPHDIIHYLIDSNTDNNDDNIYLEHLLNNVDVIIHSNI